MSTEFNFHALKSAERLPSPSGTALTIMNLVQKDDTSVKQLAEAVKVDPALTSRILNFANSAAFGAHRPIANVNEAVQMMGMQAVRNFALSLSLVSNNRKGHCADFDYNTFWMKSLAMAVAIAALTARERTAAPEEAFTLGLLSEIGQLALATVWPDIFGECLRSAQGDTLIKLECERFAIDHKALTLMLMQDWGLPGLFLDALKLSFQPPQAEVTRTVRFASQLAFARQLSHYCVADDQYRAALLADVQKEAIPHNFTDETLSQFIDQINQQWQDWGKLINIKTDTRLAFPTTQAEQSDVLPGLDILLVDDDPLILVRLSKQLTHAGHHVAVCPDGEAALKHVLENKPQIIITDWRMQPMDGLALCRTLRSSAIGKNLYIIMLTAAETEDELVEAFDVGIDDYVTKPVNLKILLARIRAGQRITTLQQEVEREKQDIQRTNAELAVANRKLGIMANTDLLTDLPNRRYALARLAQEWESAQRYNRPISVLMLDLDHFKLVNDTLGHDAGDEVLSHTAKLLKAASRATDIACRLGGEEFLIIATNTDGKTAVLLAERIRIAIQTHQPNGLALKRPITVSIGVAGSIGNQPGWNELIKQADRALYVVKAGRRNATQLASEL
ncbi:diguanylate cyclase response regulator [Methylomonas lenta]|uniref:diguanylate cyclase n=1 Tax=Methylomonas lenta TaxID=980561 RepID=A0A177NH18_9GAMM|nr:diguanylate cyclase [Methylomonas lenta]OAI17152.1 diguanylate cyclase response regulator [Methylomonas lenta]